MQSLKWSVISFTEKGAELAEKIKRLSKEQQLPCEIHTYHGRKQVENLNAWTKEQFSLMQSFLSEHAELQCGQLPHFLRTS